ncbi:tetratricopeptide repeat-containing glycosyltransferase family protein [Microbacteriaceae bacterium K1510]|nr:tetratricopeptide repeat-containing glycosyltransferase family protein [Microbacteriaceae bacterium K1510]
MTETTAHKTAAELLQQGLFHHRQGQIGLAMERYTEVLKSNPNNGEALYYVAVVACQEGQYKQGAELARKAIANGLDTAKVHNLLGQALDRLEEPLEAIKSFDRAIAVDPNMAEAHGNRANILVDAGLPEEALKSFARALALNLNSPSDLLNRGALLQDLDRHAEALADYEAALKIVPDAPNVLMNKGNALAMLGRYAEAEAVYDTVLKTQPKHALALAHKGLAVKHQGRFDEARAALERSMELEPKDANNAVALGHLLMLLGEWRKGFPFYEQRVDMPQRAYTPLDGPQWQGEPPGDFRLVLVSEQGLGDTVQMARYASVLAGRGYPVWVLTRDVLAPLMRTLSGVERVVTSADDLKADPRRILWAPMMSLPRLLHLMPDAVAAQEPYLTAEPERVARWAEELKGQGNEKALKVGIVWQGTTAASAAPLAALAPLAEVEGVRLISLQKQPGPNATLVPFAAKIERPLDENDLSAEGLLETAAVMANLDVVVSIDSMPAHLAGALGKPVFLALPYVPDWRWLTERTDTAWYPSTTLFRQGTDRQWQPVFAAIAARLRAGLTG